LICMPIDDLLLAGISNFTSISAQDHTPAAISGQPRIALAVAGEERLLSRFC
jgi:hypothetical protein